MAIINGTQGNDDGISNPVLRSPGDPSVLYGFGGDDVLISSSRPFDETPDVLYGGTGNDRYVLGVQGQYFIYSTPIIWVPYAADVDIHEAASVTDTNDRLDMALGGYDIQTSMVFNGSDVIISTYARTVRLFDDYDVDAAGNLISGVDFAEIKEYSVASPLISHDLKLQGSEVTFVRNGSAGVDFLAGDAQGNVIDGRDGNDNVSGGGGNDFITGGEGDDLVDGGEGDDRLFGGHGADSLSGGAGNDKLRGMTGNDHLEGGAGDDLYSYNLADGHDTITETLGADVIQFGAGITQADIAISQNGANLLIALADGSITVLGQGNGSGGRVERLRFDDGSEIDLSQVVNWVPVARDDLFSVVEGSSISGNLFAANGAGADSDPDGHTLTTQARSFATANGGTVTIAANGAFTYLAASGFAGADTLTYSVADGFGGSGSATVTVNVLANLAPDARDDMFSVVQGRSISGNLFADNGGGADADPDGSILSIEARSFVTANGGTVSIAANGTFIYRAAAGFAGADTLTYSVKDAYGKSDSATVTVNVQTNLAPLAKADRFAGTEDRALTGNVLADNGAGADSDANGDSLTITAQTLTTARGGSVTMLANGNFTYTPKANFNGQDSFVYIVSDPSGLSSNATATIDLASVNDAPTAVADSIAAVTSTLKSGNLLLNDSDIEGDALSAAPTSFTTARGGAVTVSPNGQFTYQNFEGLLGADSFSYTLLDSKGGSATGSATVQLSAPAGAMVGGIDDDIIRGTAGIDIILGQSGKDEVYGGGGADKIYGGAGDDDLNGDGGNDQLFGGQGNDKLLGGAGNDRLAGNSGIDELRGGPGADRFVFWNIGDGPDLIKDFKVSEKDVIDLAALFDKPFDSATQAVTDFVRITQSGTSSVLAFDADGTGGAANFVTLATLSGTIGLTDEAALFASGQLVLFMA